MAAHDLLARVTNTHAQNGPTAANREKSAIISVSAMCIICNNMCCGNVDLVEFLCHGPEN